MSDESERFLLQYSVDLRDSVQKLKDLEEKIDKLFESQKKHNDGIDEGNKKFSASISKVTSQVNKLIPGLASGIEKGASFAATLSKVTPIAISATVALSAMAYSIRQINNLRKEYAQQRETAWAVGLGPIGVEQAQREFTAASGGRLNGEQGRSLLTKIQSQIQSAYTDPNPANSENLRLGLAGTSAYGANGQMKSTAQALDDIGAKMRSVSLEQANAIGQTLGLTQNETLAIRNRNDALKESQEMSGQEIGRRLKANQAMESLNQSFGSLEESFRRTGNIVGEELIPVFAKIMQFFSEEFQNLPNDVDKTIHAFSIFNKAFELFMNDVQDPKKMFTGKVSWNKSYKQATDIITEQNDAAKLAADKQNDAAQTQKNTAANNEKAIRLFSSSVNTMAGVVDESQAWAAWAGSVGQAGGLKGIGGGAAGRAVASGGGNGFQYGGYQSPMEDAGASTQNNTGNIRNTEGGFRKFNTPEDGMKAQANQLIRYQLGKTTGRNLDTIQDIISTWAPSNENNTSEYIAYMASKMGMPSNQKIDFSDAQTLGKFMYFQAIKEKGAYVSKQYSMGDFQNAASAVLHGSSISPQAPALSSDYKTEGANRNFHAQTRDTVRLDDIYASIAQYIGGGMSVSQLRNGQAAKSDIKWALQKATFDAQKNEEVLRMQVNSPQLVKNRAQYEYELIMAQQKLKSLQQYSSTVLGSGYGGEDDPRSITVQRPVFNFYIGESKDPRATADIIHSTIKDQVNQMGNNNNTAVSH